MMLEELVDPPEPLSIGQFSWGSMPRSRFVQWSSLAIVGWVEPLLASELKKVSVIVSIC